MLYHGGKRRSTRRYAKLVAEADKEELTRLRQQTLAAADQITEAFDTGAVRSAAYHLWQKGSRNCLTATRRLVTARLLAALLDLQ